MCKKEGRKLYDDEDCKICFNKSFASHEKSKYWSKKNEKLAREIFLNSNKKFLFDCPDCKHKIKQSPGKIVSMGQWCVICSGKKFCKNSQCNFCFHRSFASSTKIKYLYKPVNEKEKYPEEVSINSRIKFTFKCHKVGETDAFGVNGMCCTSGHSAFATFGSDGTVVLWNKDKRQKLKGFNQMTAPITSAAFNKDGRLLAYATGYDYSRGKLGLSTCPPPQIYLHAIDSTDLICPPSYE